MRNKGHVTARLKARAFKPAEIEFFRSVFSRADSIEF
jgi:hypothetical protein